MSKINLIVIHCSDTPESMDVSIEDITNWHTWPRYDLPRDQYRYMGKWYDRKEDLPKDVRDKKGNGWSTVGYHLYIRKNGDIEEGVDLGKPGIHCRGYNENSIAVAVEGRGNLSDPQWGSLKHSVLELLDTNPDAEVKGHGELDERKDYCPGFNVQDWVSTNLNIADQYL